jgi:hypothetical protein
MSTRSDGLIPSKPVDDIEEGKDKAIEDAKVLLKRAEIEFPR